MAACLATGSPDLIAWARRPTSAASIWIGSSMPPGPITCMTLPRGPPCEYGPTGPPNPGIWPAAFIIALTETICWLGSSLISPDLECTSTPMTVPTP